jgi:hypothetical protein
MHYRTVIGIWILAAVCIIPIVAAFPSVNAFFVEPTRETAVRTGNVTVMTEDSLGSWEKTNVVYVGGDVFELPANAVSVSKSDGVVYVSMATTSDLNPVTFPLLSKSGGETGYAVSSVTVVNDRNPLLVNDKAFSVMPSTANYYADEVPTEKRHEWVDLDWRDKTKDLSLTVYAPDATFGPFMDMADGKKDGRIFLDMSSRLNVTPGHWFFKIQNSNPDRTDYTLNTYSV